MISVVLSHLPFGSPAAAAPNSDILANLIRRNPPLPQEGAYENYSGK
jgi:hypothetical protein